MRQIASDREGTTLDSSTMDAGAVINTHPSSPGIDLYWIPLGAGGSGFVRFNGRTYEAIKARLERRPSLALFHTALEVRTIEGCFVVETVWPSPPGAPCSRGVVRQGAVAAPQLARLRLFRYEVRRWRNGTLPDAGMAVGGAQRISDDPDDAHRLLDWTGSVPQLVWGRDQLITGDMWNSNSVISWLLCRTGLSAEEIRPPTGGRAPGWDAGIVVAKRGPPPDQAWLRGRIAVNHQGEGGRTSAVR